MFLSTHFWILGDATNITGMTIKYAIAHDFNQTFKNRSPKPTLKAISVNEITHVVISPIIKANAIFLFISKLHFHY
jgi:hypothetical protein